MTKLKFIASHAIFATILSQPIIALAQTQAQHREAQREQDAYDKRHHNTAKTLTTGTTPTDRLKLYPARTR